MPTFVQLALAAVRDGCMPAQTPEGPRRRAKHQAHLEAGTDRIRAEGNDMLEEVRARRRSVDADIASLPAPELEAVIAAHHGKRRTGTLLRRTRLSRTEALAAFHAAGAA